MRSKFYLTYKLIMLLICGLARRKKTLTNTHLDADRSMFASVNLDSYINNSLNVLSVLYYKLLEGGVVRLLASLGSLCAWFYNRLTLKYIFDLCGERYNFDGEAGETLSVIASNPRSNRPIAGVKLQIDLLINGGLSKLIYDPKLYYWQRIDFSQNALLINDIINIANDSSKDFLTRSVLIQIKLDQANLQSVTVEAPKNDLFALKWSDKILPGRNTLTLLLVQIIRDYNSRKRAGLQVDSPLMRRIIDSYPQDIMINPGQAIVKRGALAKGLFVYIRQYDNKVQTRCDFPFIKKRDLFIDKIYKDEVSNGYNFYIRMKLCKGNFKVLVSSGSSYRLASLELLMLK